MKNRIYRSLFVLFLIASLTLALSGCGSAPEGSADGSDNSGASGAAVDLESIKTLGDAFAVSGVDEYSEQRSTYQGKYIYAFTVDGVAYRVIAELPSDIEEKILALEFDDDYDKNEKALVADLPVTTAEDLTSYILPQEELDKLVGKTGKELEELGWRGGSFYNGNEGEAWIEYGPYAYSVHFDGEVAEDAEDFDDFEDLADRKVLDATFEGLGDATNLE